MRKETCAICGKIVYVEQGEEFEWDPGAVQCSKLDQFFCAEHKPCCAADLHEVQCTGSDEEVDDDEYDDFDDDEEDVDEEDADYEEGEDPDIDDFDDEEDGDE